MRSADDGIGPKPALNFKFLGCAHIDQSKEAIDIHHEVLRLEVAVDDAAGVEMLHHEQDLGGELPCMLRGEGDYFGDDVEEVLSLNELHYEVDEVGVLYQFVEANHEGKPRHSPQYFLLVHDVLDDLGLLDVGTV